MSTSLVSQYSQFYDFDVSVQNHINIKMNSADHLAVGAPVNSLQSRINNERNFPIGTFSATSAFVPVTPNSNYSSTIMPPPSTSTLTSTDCISHQRKLDRSWSEPCDKLRTLSTATANTTSAAVNSSRYKTELCRPFEENGHCKYGDKCQFAHGKFELQNLARHPKYKTDLCRTFHTIGFCPYGPRCHFVHSEEERKLKVLQQLQAQQQAQQQLQQAQQHPGVIQPPSRPNSIKFTSLSSLGSSMDSPCSSLNGSPTTLSPAFGSDDIFSSANLTTFSPNNNNQQSVSSGSARSSPICNSSDWMTPLNVQTQMNTVNDMSALQQQFTGLNMNHQKTSTFDNLNQQNVFDDNFLAQVFREAQSYNDAVPSTSPVDSLSGVSVGSSSSSGSGSPLEGSNRGMRLPIFNRLSQES